MKLSRIRPAALVFLLLPLLPSLATAQDDGERPARDYGASFLQLDPSRPFPGEGG